MRPIDLRRFLTFSLALLVFMLMMSCSASYHVKKALKKGAWVDTTLTVTNFTPQSVDFSQEYKLSVKPRLITFFSDSLPELTEPEKETIIRYVEREIDSAANNLQPIDTTKTLDNGAYVRFQMNEKGEINITSQQPQVIVNCPEPEGLINWSYLKWWQWGIVAISFLIFLFLIRFIS